MLNGGGGGGGGSLLGDGGILSIIYQLGSLIGGSTGSKTGGTIGGFFGGITGLIASLFHEGGVVGHSPAVRVRPVPAALFNHAPRFHSGLLPDEFPAILQSGETVLSRTQGKEIRQKADVMPHTEQQEGKMSSQARPVIVNINTPDANSFRRAEQQVSAQVSRSMRHADRRNN